MPTRPRKAAKAAKKTAPTQHRAPAAGVGSAPAPATPTANPGPSPAVLAELLNPGRALAPTDGLHEPEDYPEAPTLAPVFPTAQDVADIGAQLDADHGPFTSERERTRALQAEIRDRAEQLSAGSRRQSAAHRQRTLAAVLAPVFPTEAHVELLQLAVPNLTDAEQQAVINAGHAAFVASIAAGEPITEVA